MALIGTMSALVLGLLVGSAKSSYDAQKDELTSLSAGALLVDRILSLYGPEAQDAREQLREVVAGARDQIWNGAPPTKGADIVYAAIHRLSPKDAEQQSLKDQASSMIVDLAKTRMLMLEQQRQRGVDAASDRGGLLAHDQFHQLRPLRASQRHRRHGACSCALSRSPAPFS